MTCTGGCPAKREHDSRLGLFVNRAALAGRARIARLERLVSHVHAIGPGIIVGPVAAVSLGLWVSRTEARRTALGRRRSANQTRRRQAPARGRSRPPSSPSRPRTATSAVARSSCSSGRSAASHTDTTRTRREGFRSPRQTVPVPRRGSSNASVSLQIQFDDFGRGFREDMAGRGCREKFAAPWRPCQDAVRSAMI